MATRLGKKIELFLPWDVILVSKLYESSCVAQFLVSNTAKQNGSTQHLNLIHEIFSSKDVNLSHWLKIYWELYANLYFQSYAVYTANPT